MTMAFSTLRVGEAAGHQFPVGVRIERSHRKQVVGVEARTDGVNRGFERFEFPGQPESDARSLTDLGRVLFGYRKFDFQRRSLGQFGHDYRRRSVSPLADVAQPDDPVERRAQFGQADIGFDQGDVGVQGRQFGARLFVGFLADGVLFEQCALTVHAVFGQLQLGFEFR